jgi:putative transposase
MRRSKFTESQIVAALQEVEGGVPIAEVIRKHGISRATFFTWKSKYGGATVAELKRLRELEAENAKLKRMYAELALENAAIKDVLSRKL